MNLEHPPAGVAHGSHLSHVWHLWHLWDRPTTFFVPPPDPSASPTQAVQASDGRAVEAPDVPATDAEVVDVSDPPVEVDSSPAAIEAPSAERTLESPARVTRVIAIANQKGGVGKSTTAVSLGAALAEMGYAVLVADLDPQGNASTGLGIRHSAREVTIYEVLAAEAAIEDAVVETPVENLWAIPSTIALAGAEIELVSQFSREMRLARALEPIRDGRFQFILLDCPPSLGLLTVNALTAADELLVPIQCEYYALEGLGQLLRNVRLIQQNVNSRLRLTGIVMTMFDRRTKLAEQVVAEVRRYFGPRVYDTVIPRSVRLSEAPGYGQPISTYDPSSIGARAYRWLAEEVAERPVEDGSVPVPGDLPEVMQPAPPPGQERRRFRMFRREGVDR